MTLQVKESSETLSSIKSIYYERLKKIRNSNKISTKRNTARKENEGLDETLESINLHISNHDTQIDKKTETQIHSMSLHITEILSKLSAYETRLEKLVPTTSLNLIQQ